MRINLKKLIIMKTNEEFKKLLIPLTESEYETLKENLIKDKKCRDPLVVWNDTIIDGHNRFEICQEFGIPFTTVQMQFESIEQVKEWIILNQFGRRNLTTYQRSCLALQLDEYYREKAKNNQKLSPGRGQKGCQKSENLKIDTNKVLAKIAGVSKDTIVRVKKIESEAPDDTKKKLSENKITINNAIKALKKIEKIKLRKELAERGRMLKIVPDLRLGDFEKVLEDIPDGSVDCIITDPPYGEEFLPEWSKLALFAKKKLKENGILVAYTGHMFLKQVMDRLSEHLNFYWMLHLKHNGQTKIVHPVNVLCEWKPILVYQNGRQYLKRGGIHDSIKSGQREKDLHEWQQAFGEAKELVNMFTDEGSLVVEPFGGSCTTLIACLQTKRRVIAAELNEDTYNSAKVRIDGYYQMIRERIQKIRWLLAHCNREAA
jgi:tRNA G10  N-methylase Trm11